MKIVTTALFYAILMAQEVYGQTVYSGTVYEGYQGVNLYEIIQSANVVGSGLLVLQKPTPDQMQEQIRQAAAVRKLTSIPAVLALRPREYVTRPPRMTLEPAPIDYPYYYYPPGPRSIPNVYDNYISSLGDYASGMKVVFCGNYTAEEYRVNWVEDERVVDLKGLAEIKALEGGSIGYAGLNQEIATGKSPFAVGYALSLIFNKQTMAAAAVSDSALPPDPTDVAQAWVASLPDSFLSSAQKQSLYVSRNVMNRHDPELDEAWIYSLHSWPFKFKDDDQGSETYCRYILDIGYTMLANDFTDPKNGKNLKPNAKAQFATFINNIGNLKLRKEQMAKYKQLYPVNATPSGATQPH